MKADNTSYIPNSFVPSISKYLLTKSNSTDYSKIILSIIVNYVRYNSSISKLALDTE